MLLSMTCWCRRCARTGPTLCCASCAWRALGCAASRLGCIALRQHVVLHEQKGLARLSVPQPKLGGSGVRAADTCPVQVASFTLFAALGPGSVLTAFHRETKLRRSFNCGSGDFIMQPLAIESELRWALPPGRAAACAASCRAALHPPHVAESPAPRAGHHPGPSWWRHLPSLAATDAIITAAQPAGGRPRQAACGAGRCAQCTRRSSARRSATSTCCPRRCICRSACAGHRGTARVPAMPQASMPVWLVQTTASGCTGYGRCSCRTPSRAAWRPGCLCCCTGGLQP